MIVGESWRQHARRVLQDVAREWWALPERERTPEALEMMIVQAYPYGPRENYPYKAWLTERRLLLVELGFRRADPNDAALLEREALIAAGQQELPL